MVVNIKSKKHASSRVPGHAGSRGSLLAKLFLSTLYLSAFTFGGGYVIVTLMKKKLVDEYHWIDEQEMLDLVAIAQSSPGAIAVNGAIVVGYKLAGMAGVLTAVIATGLGFWAALMAFGYHTNPAETTFIFLLANTLGSAVPTPGGLGAVEAVLSVAFTAVGIPSSIAVSATLVYRIAFYWLRIPVGALAMKWLDMHNLI